MPIYQNITYQDYLDASDKPRFLREAVQRYRLSPFFRQALDASAYFRGENPAIAGKTILRADRLSAHGLRQDVTGQRVGSGFFFRFVCQQNQYLLQNGAVMPEDCKRRLGRDFDRRLAEMGELALVQGVCHAFFNADHIEPMPAVSSPLSGCFLLPDETTGEARAAIRFWQLEPRRPQQLLFYEEDGVTAYRGSRGCLTPQGPKQPYLQLRRGDKAVAAAWKRLPVLTLRANPDGHSELTPPIRAKIDAYDRILSDFADNLERANDVYWVLNNFGGSAEDIAATLAEISRLKAVASYSDGSGASATAEPHTIDVPYAARTAALELLRRALYEDFMALDATKLTGGSLTNVAIRAARADLDLKCDRWEWQVFRFVRSLLLLVGCDTEEIRFPRQTFADDRETVDAIYRMRADLDRETALKLNPLLQPEEITRMLDREAT